MYLDALLQFSDSQAVTATAVSTNVINLGTGGRDIGVGEDLYFFIGLPVAMTDAGSDSTVTVTVEVDDNESFTSATVAQTIGVFPALSAAGAKLIAKIQPLAVNEQYVRLRYTVANGNLTTGSIDAAIMKDVDAYKFYQDAITIS